MKQLDAHFIVGYSRESLTIYGYVLDDIKTQESHPVTSEKGLILHPSGNEGIQSSQGRGCLWESAR